jgi:hypothetical protein
MKDRDATLQEVNQWATTVYRPALERVDQLGDAERDKIARELARYIPPWMITAMGRDKAMRVFVSTGRYDPLNCAKETWR